jgi:hypothetical protein
MAIKLAIQPIAKIPHCPRFAFSPDGQSLVGLPQSSPARLFDTRTWKKKLEFKKTGDLGAAAFSPDGEVVALAEVYQYLGTYRTATGAAINKWRITKEFHEISGVIVSPSATEVIYACRDNVIRVFDAMSGKSTRELPVTEKSAMVAAITLSPKGDELAAAWTTRAVDDPKQWESTVMVWDWPGGRELRRLTLFGIPTDEPEDSHEIQGLLYCPTGREFAAINGAGAIGLFDAQNGCRKAEIRQEVIESYGHLAVSPDGKWLAASDKGHLFLWALPGGTLLRDLQIDESSSHRIEFSPDSALLAAATNQILVWRLSDLIE